jgi:hypothetical protein
MCSGGFQDFLNFGALFSKLHLTEKVAHGLRWGLRVCMGSGGVSVSESSVSFVGVVS